MSVIEVGTERNLEVLLGDLKRVPDSESLQHIPYIHSRGYGLPVNYLPSDFTKPSVLTLEELAGNFIMIMATAYFDPEGADVLIFRRNLTLTNL